MITSSLQRKVAVVTGGASGIGLATVDALAELGADVVVADVQPPPAGTAARYVRVDVGRPEDWDALVAIVTEELGGIDVAHLNAGVGCPEASDIVSVTDDRYGRIVDVNQTGVFLGTRAVVPSMTARGGGAIVVTASVAGLMPLPFDPLYAATKHAVVGFVRSMAPNLAGAGITINALCPAWVDTPMLLPESRDELEQAGAVLIAPREVAGAVVDCVIGDATGQVYVCQAGAAPIPYRFRGIPGPVRAGTKSR